MGAEDCEDVLVEEGGRPPVALRVHVREVNGELLELGGYAGIIDYEPSELVLTARCGTRLSELERVLDEHRDRIVEAAKKYGKTTAMLVSGVGRSPGRMLRLAV